VARPWRKFWKNNLRTGNKKYKFVPTAGHAIAFMLACVLIFILGILTELPAIGQNQPDDPPTQAAPLFPLSGWSPDMVGPPYVEDRGEIVTSILPAETEQVPYFRVYEDINQQIPVLQVHGQYFDPSGICANGPLSEESTQSVRNRMKKTYEMGFRCFLLRVDWPSIEPQSNRLEIERLRELLQYADDIGLKVIISLELHHAPRWFFRGTNGSSRVMVSYLVDPDMETASGNDGDLRWSDGSGIPILYHSDTINASKRIIYSLYNTIGKEPALLGWYMDGPVSMTFPGGGHEGVVGMTDYSPFTVSSYSAITGSIFMTYPLTRYSQGSWDSRPEFRELMDFRLRQKRDAFNELLDTLLEVDEEHMILVGMNTVLNYRNDNGYKSMVTVPDATRQFLYDGVDGAVINFQLSSKSFDATNSHSETSAIHLSLTINQLIRNGRAALVLVEKDYTDPPSLNDITNLAQMIKASGAYPIWCSGFVQQRSHRWSWPEENAIERTQPLSLLPPPKRLRRGQVAIFDLPQYYATFYAEETGNLPLALIQLAIHQRTGVLLEVVSTDELVGGQPVLQQYNNIIYLAPELLANRDAKSWFSPTAQVALYGYSMGSSGIIEAVDPMLLHQYVLEDYHSFPLEDQLRTRYVHRGATADLLHGADGFIIANDPYVFMRVNDTRFAKYIDVKLAGWPISTLDRISMVNSSTGSPVQLEMISGSASFPLASGLKKAQLYVLMDDYLKVALPYENRSVGVIMTQQSRNMRRSVPAALLLAALLAVTLIWMTFQSQQRSLLQAAELIDRRRQIEPIDILDEPEVMEFYKTYISGQEDESEKPPDQP